MIPSLALTAPMKKILFLFTAVILTGQGCFARPQPEQRPAPAPLAPPTTPVPVPTTEPTPTPTPTPSSPAPAPQPQPVTHNATIQDFAFAPSTIRVKKGDRVVFTNRDSIGHTVTADGGAFDSSLILQNQTFTLDTSNLVPGSYPFHCTPHPNMRGTIVVE